MGTLNSQMGQSVEDVAAAAQAMSTQVEDVSASAESLATMAQILRDLVAQFRLSTEPNELIPEQRRLSA
jgi:methyl-accepting chemotaxis protein